MKLHTLGGEPGDAAVLMLHGFGADRFSWLGTAPALAERALVLAADLPSHGSAADERVTGFDSLVDDMIAGLEAEPAWQAATHRHVIGHSLGGALAIVVAARSARPVQTLSVIAPVGLDGVTTPSSNPADSSTRTSIDLAWLQQLIRLDDEARAMTHLQQLVENPRLITRQLPAMLVQHLARQGVRDGLAALVGDVPGIGASIAADLASLALPRTVIWGEADRINRLDADALARFGGDAVVLPDCGHLPHIERRLAVNEALLSRIDASAARPHG